MPDNRTMIWISLSADLFLWGMISNLFGPSSPKIMDEFKIDFTLAGTAVSAMSFGGMFSACTGKFADIYGSLYVTRLSLLLMGLLTALTGLSDSVFSLFLLSFLTGISIGTFQASFSQAVMDLYPEAKIKMLTLIQVFFGVGATIGPTATAIIISSFNSWRSGYLLYGIILNILAIIQFYLRAPTTIKKTVAYGKEEYGTSFLILLAGMLLIFVWGAGVNSWLPTYIVSTGKASYLEASAILSCFWGATTVMRGLVGKIAEKVDEKTMLIWLTTTGFVMGVLSLFASGFVPNAIIWSVVGLSFAPVYPLIITITYNRYRRSPGRIIGRLVAIGNAGALISAPLIGEVNSISNPHVATLIIPISSLTIAILFFRLKTD
ncbi:MAG: MFS transporter [Nitrososphaeria archaeon]